MTVTSYGVKLRLPVYEADGITIAVVLCQGGRWRHFGLFLTRDATGKDPKRPRYFAGCRYSRPETGTVPYVARMADLGDDLYNLTFNRKQVKASWRTIYVVPTASDLDFGNTTTPYLLLNCNPASRFRIPRWLIARLIALQFRVFEVRNTETLQVLSFFCDYTARIYISLGSCVDHRDLSNPSPLWAKLDINHPTVYLDAFTHNCFEDHIDSESWATGSKVFGDADRSVLLSLSPSGRMSDSVLVIHLELFGRVFEQMLHEAGDSSLSLSSAADLESHRPRPASNNPVVVSSRSQTHAQIEPTPSPRQPSTPAMLHRLLRPISPTLSVPKRSFDGFSIASPALMQHELIPNTPARGDTQGKKEALETADGGKCAVCITPSEATGVDTSITIQGSQMGGQDTVMDGKDGAELAELPDGGTQASFVARRSTWGGGLEQVQVATESARETQGTTVGRYIVWWS